jgi:transcriptional regulator with GAF, ATPase, and Fis domain
MNTRFVVRAAAFILVAVMCSMAEPWSNAPAVCLSGAPSVGFQSLFGSPWCASVILIAATFLTMVQLMVFIRTIRRESREPTPAAVSRSLWGYWGIGTTLACATFGIAASLWTPASDAHVFQAYVLAAALVGWCVDRARTDDWLRRARDALAMTASVAVGLTTAAAVAALWLTTRKADAAQMSWYSWTPWLAAPLIAWLYRVRARWVSRTPAAFVRACRHARQDLTHATTLEDLTAHVLLPFTRLPRRNARSRIDESAEGESAHLAGFVLSMDPPRQATLNRAGFAVVHTLTPPAEVRAWLGAHIGAVVMRQVLERQAVRLPEIRPVLTQLHEWDALCAVPLGRNEELVGVLVLPNDRRPRALSLHESEALQSLAAHVGAHLDLWGALARSHTREQSLQREHKHVIESLESLGSQCQQAEQDDQARWQAWWSTATASAESAVTIAYSAAMQRALASARERLDAHMPLLVVSPWGNPADQWVAHVHHQTGVARPLRYVSCPMTHGEASETPFERLKRARIHTPHTVVFRDVHLLDLSTQHALAHAITRRQLRRDDGTQLESVHARIVATTHLTEQAIDIMTQRGEFSATLWSALRPHLVRIPSLMERTEDLQALIFATLGQACQKLGAPPIGLVPDALQLLLTHPWPGNWSELCTAIHLAVHSAMAAGTHEDRLRPEHLAPYLLARVTADAHPTAAEGAEGKHRPAGMTAAAINHGVHPMHSAAINHAAINHGVHPMHSETAAYDGTYAELEKQILLHALQRAHGNKSEAARRLAIKRSTFIDKLARHGVG